MSYPPETTFNGVHLLICALASFAGFLIGFACGYCKGYDSGGGGRRRS